MTAAKTAQGPTLKVAVAGQLAEASNPQSFGGIGTLLGVFLAALVLAFIFRSGFAMALPLISALASLGTAIGVIGLLSHLLKMPQFSVELVALIGLGVGVDYALFIVTRHRQGLIAGNDTEASIVNAVNTSGRAVLFAGIIVCIALLGMFALGVTFLYGLAVAAAIGVALHHARRPHPAPRLARVHRAARCSAVRRSANWPANGPRVVGTRYHRLLAPVGRTSIQTPLRSCRPALALVVIVLMALPFFSLRLGSLRPGQRPDGHHHPPGLRPVWPRASGPASTGRCSWSPSSPGPADQPASSTTLAKRRQDPARCRRGAPRRSSFPPRTASRWRWSQVYPIIVAPGRRPPPP